MSWRRGGEFSPSLNPPLSPMCLCADGYYLQMAAFEVSQRKGPIQGLDLCVKLKKKQLE